MNNEYKCIDIMNVKEFPKADMIWTDPPWEQRMVKYFETVMHKQTGLNKPHNDIDAILIKFAVLSKMFVDKPIVVEYSKYSYERVINIMQKYGGHKHIATKKSTYLSPNELDYVLIVFNKDVDMNLNLKDTKIITDALKKISPTGSVFDCFAGIGATKKAVNKAGWKYIGYELNPARYKKLIS